MINKPHSNLYEKTNYKDIREAVQHGITRYADRVAFTLKEKINKEVKYTDITYKEFGNQINELGTGLISLGLKDKKIAIIGPNSYEWVLSYTAVLFGTGIVVPLDKGLPAQEIEDSIIRSGADAIIFDSKYMDIINDIQNTGKTQLKQYICMQNVEDNKFDSIENVRATGEEELAKGNTSFVNAEIDAEKASIILFTSGTTSLSKAVMLSHKNIASDINSMNSAEKLYNTDTNLVLLPFHHTFGSTGILLMLNNGVRNVFCDGLRHIQENMKEYKVSVYVCVPLLLEAIHKKIYAQIKKQGKEKTVNRAKKLANALLKVGIDIRKKLFKEILDQLGGNMRFIVSGAAAIDKTVAEDFNTWGILTIQGYGLTETSPVLSAENEKFIRPGSVGIPLPDMEVKIDNPNEDGIGEIIAKGPNVMLGYYNNEEATNQVLIDGWYHTGDLGYIDKQGYIFITGRKKNVIVLKNGKNIFPEEIEVLISKLPYVAENIVFGYPKDDDYVLSAKIVYDENYVKQNYKDYSQEQLEEMVWEDIKNINNTVPKYKHVKKFILTNEPMIKTTTAKIKKFEEVEKIIKEEQIKF